MRHTGCRATLRHLLIAGPWPPAFGKRYGTRRLNNAFLWQIREADNEQTGEEGIAHDPSPCYPSLNGAQEGRVPQRLPIFGAMSPLNLAEKRVPAPLPWVSSCGGAGQSPARVHLRHAGFRAEALLLDLLRRGN